MKVKSERVIWIVVIFLHGEIKLNKLVTFIINVLKMTNSDISDFGINNIKVSEIDDVSWNEGFLVIEK